MGLWTSRIRSWLWIHKRWLLLAILCYLGGLAAGCIRGAQTAFGIQKELAYWLYGMDPDRTIIATLLSSIPRSLLLYALFWLCGTAWPGIPVSALLTMGSGYVQGCSLALLFAAGMPGTGYVLAILAKTVLGGPCIIAACAMAMSCAVKVAKSYMNKGSRGERMLMRKRLVLPMMLLFLLHLPSLLTTVFFR